MKRELKDHALSRPLALRGIARPIPMKRELKEARLDAGYQGVSLDRKAHPDEKGTERAGLARSQALRG